MDKKYIVKNCPCFLGEDIQCASYPVLCKNKHDCLIKQVIEKCKNIECPCELESLDCPECSIRGRKTLAEQILQLFEIEECK